MSLHARNVERDVRELSTLLGEVLADQASPAALETVESVRTGAIDYRRGNADSRAGLRSELAGLDAETREVVARAFTTYFELTNLAEERERVRAVREGTQAGTLADSVTAAVERLREGGQIKRIGCVVNHVVTGFRNNCMVVWDVPDDELDARGERVGELPYVTLCYHRPRRPAHDWPYNLFTMIHGREADAVDAKIDDLAADHLPFPHERLYSTGTLKQTGARYEDLLAGD